MCYRCESFQGGAKAIIRRVLLRYSAKSGQVLRDHAPGLRLWRSSKRRWSWDELPDPVRWPSLVVGPDRGLEQTAELLLLPYQEMIRASSLEGSHKVFVIWHWLVASDNGVCNTLIPSIAATCATCCPMCNLSPGSAMLVCASMISPLAMMVQPRDRPTQLSAACSRYHQHMGVVVRQREVLGEGLKLRGVYSLL